MEKDTRARKWLLTINNPREHGFTQDRIKAELAEIKSLEYWCMCDEIGENGTYHTHLYIACSNAVRFSTLKGKFPTAHFDPANGTSQQNRDYVRKEGKWENDKKKETNLPDTFMEEGEMPTERQGARNDLSVLYAMIKQGMSDYEILESNPDYMFNLDKIERARQTIKQDQFKDQWRALETTYIFGDTGTGKTRSVMDLNGYRNVFRVTDYDHPFDNYKGQDIVVFEEFRSSLKIQDMLNYLDGYPLELPCRYANKIACFTKVFIITNLDLFDQYQSIQKDHPQTWEAFMRRIHKVQIFSKDTPMQEFDLASVMYQPVWQLFPMQTTLASK